jgi:hypothetical protein
MAERVKPQWKWELTQDMRAIQPSLRDFVKFGLGPGVKTPGYYHDVPSGQRWSIRV